MPGSILAVSALAVTSTLSLGLVSVSVSAAAVAAQRTAGAADAAALAAADAASGAVPGEPCENAQLVAAAHGIRIVSCEVDELIVTVRLEGRFAAFPIPVAARAGPPSAQH